MSPRTTRRWAQQLVAQEGFDRHHAVHMAKAWAVHHSVGGAALLAAVREYRKLGITVPEAALWILNGVDYADVAVHYRDAGLDSVEGGYLFDRAWADDDFLPTDGFWIYATAGIPLSLIVLILWAGATTRADVADWLRRWRAREPVEPALRVLAALSGSPKPVPPPDGPPRFPPRAIGCSPSWLTRGTR